MLITQTEWALIDAWRALRRRRNLALAAGFGLCALLAWQPAQASGGLAARSADGGTVCDAAVALPGGHWMVLCREDGR